MKHLISSLFKFEYNTTKEENRYLRIVFNLHVICSVSLLHFLSVVVIDNLFLRRRLLSMYVDRYFDFVGTDNRRFWYFDHLTHCLSFVGGNFGILCDKKNWQFWFFGIFSMNVWLCDKDFVTLSNLYNKFLVIHLSSVYLNIEILNFVDRNHYFYPIFKHNESFPRVFQFYFYTFRFWSQSNIKDMQVTRLFWNWKQEKYLM